MGWSPAVQSDTCNDEGLPSSRARKEIRREAPEPILDYASYDCQTQETSTHLLVCHTAAEFSSAADDHIQELTSLASQEILT